MKGARAMHKWEYKEAHIQAIRFIDQLNKLGKEGWEFCCNLGGGPGYVFLFKRPLYDEKSWDRAMDGMLDLFDDEGGPVTKEGSVTEEEWRLDWSETVGASNEQARMAATWPSADEFAKFRALREYVFEAIAEELEIDAGCKSYEGRMAIWFPHYFMENTFAPEQKSDNWCVQLNCYVLGPTRHYDWCGATLGEAVDKAEREIRTWRDSR